MIAFVGWALVHLFGAVIRHFTTRCGWGAALKSPSSMWFGVAVLSVAALGFVGTAVLVLLIFAATQGKLGTTVSPKPSRMYRWWGMLAALILARPWVPTLWDEFVWLGKARLESLNFGTGIKAALEPTAQLIPAGYPPLWPELVGWLSLGTDALATHVCAASVVTLVCVLTALESLAECDVKTRPALLALVIAVAAPLVWVHLRSTYVDMPVGLLGFSLLFQLLRHPERPRLDASVLALVLCGFKDEGLVQVLAATSAAFWVCRIRTWRIFMPSLVALTSVATWRMLVHFHEVPVFDHTFSAFAWSWIPRLLQLLVLHASDFFSWGVFWAVTFAVLCSRLQTPTARALRVMLVLLLTFFAIALLSGPEKVRVFAENGTLLNRLLLQLWPAAAALLLLSLPVTENEKVIGQGA